MRIIGGFLKGRKFTPPAKNWPTRPTTDFAKEGLYNILLNRIDFENVKFLDLFGGTGNHCYEFISRGCQEATYVDNHRGCVTYVKKISNDFGIDDNLKVVAMNVFTFIKNCEEVFDVIFSDPPYAHKKMLDIPNMIFENKLLSTGGILVVEHDNKSHFQDHPNFLEERNYGGSAFSFFSN